jgi:hypothetical protein
LAKGFSAPQEYGTAYAKPRIPKFLSRAVIALVALLTATLAFAYFVAFVGVDSKVWTHHWYPQGLEVLPGGFQGNGLGGKTVRRAYQSPLNGVSVSGFVTMALTTLLLVNHLFRRGPAPGPVDRLLAKAADSRRKLPRVVPFLAPAVLMVFAVGCLVNYLSAPVHFRVDPRSAIQQLSIDQIMGRDLSQTGSFIFGKGIGGAVTVTVLTPSLVREMNRKGVKISVREGPLEYQIPGARPLVLLVALILLAVCGRCGQIFGWHTHRSIFRGSLAVLAFGILTGYVVAWLVSSQAGVLTKDGDVNALWMVQFVPFAVAGIAVLAVIHRKVENLDLPAEARLGCLVLFITAGAVIPLGSYFLSDASSGSLAALWVFVYAGLSALLGLLVRVDPSPGCQERCP